MNFRKILVTGILLLGLGVGVLYGVSRFHPMSDWNISITDEKVRKNITVDRKELPIEEAVTELEVQSDMERIIVRPVKKGEKPHVVYYDTYNKDELLRSTDVTFQKGKLTVKMEQKASILKTVWNNTGETIEIVLPEDINLKMEKITVDVGTVRVENISAEKLQLETSVGEIELDHHNVGQATVNVQTGGVIWTDSKVEDLTVDVEAGSVEFKGEIYGPSVWTVDVGSVEVYTKYGQGDYQITQEASAGSIDLHGEKKSLRKGDDLALMDITVHAGSADFYFGK